jgi:hypothetical protein
LADTGLERALLESYPYERARRAVRWALGRGLEMGSIDPRDPLLLLWSGESPGVAVFPAQVLAGEDPEPLHRACLQLAQHQGYLDGPLRILPFGGGVVAMADGGIVVDSLSASDPHDAVEDIAARFVSRVSRAPAQIEVGTDLPIADLDAVSDIDVPSAPEAWRPALRAAASHARAAAVARWNLRMHQTRGWPATIAGLNRIELLRRHVDSIAAGLWLSTPLFLGEKEREILVF